MYPSRRRRAVDPARRAPVRWARQAGPTARPTTAPPTKPRPARTATSPSDTAPTPSRIPGRAVPCRHRAWPAVPGRTVPGRAGPGRAWPCLAVPGLARPARSRPRPGIPGLAAPTGARKAGTAPAGAGQPAAPPAGRAAPDSAWGRCGGRADRVRTRLRWPSRPWGVATPAPRPARAATPAGAARAGPGGYARQALRAARHPPRPLGPARATVAGPAGSRPDPGDASVRPGRRAENQVATSRPDQPEPHGDLQAEDQVATTRPDQPGTHGRDRVATSPRQLSARGRLGPRVGDGLAGGPERGSWRPWGRGGPGLVATSGRGPGAASGRAGLRGGRGGAADAEEVYVQAAGEPAAAQRRSRRIPFGAVRRTGRTGRAHRSAPSLRSGQRTGGYADHGGHLNAWPPSPAVSWRRAGPSRRRWRSAVRPDGRRSAPCPPKTQPSTTRSGPR